MRKLILFSVMAAFIAGAADYTPVTREAGGGQNAYGQITVTATSSTVTNGQIISLGAYPVIVLDHTGAETTSTNSIAAAASARVGATFVILNSSTNDIKIVDSAPVYTSGASLGPNDSLTLFVQATNKIVQVSTANN